MYLMWVQVSDTLEQVVRVPVLPPQPSARLVAVFFCLLAGLLLLLVGRSVRRMQEEKEEEEQKKKSPQRSEGLRSQSSHRGAVLCQHDGFLMSNRLNLHMKEPGGDN